jgi:4-amino-4-deoxychorismate lyase
MSVFADQKERNDAAEDFSLFTSIRYDTILIPSKENQSLCFTPNCPLYMSIHHRDRMLEAAQHFGFETNTNFLKDGEEFQRQIINASQAYLDEHEMTDTPLRV